MRAWLALCALYWLGPAHAKRGDPAVVDSLSRRSALDKNFMRFGRSSPPFDEISDDSRAKEDFSRGARGKQDAFVRFSRTPNGPKDFSRPGRGKDDFMRFGRAPQDDTEVFLRTSRGKQDNFVRFGRLPKEDFDDFFRFERGKQGDFMRFGRRPQDDLDIFFRPSRGKQDNFVRFGRTPQEDVNDFFRSGRGKQDNFVRFGRKPKDDVDIFFGKRGKQGDFMRFGRNPKDDVDMFFENKRGKQDDFMRFGRTPQGDINDIFRSSRGKQDNFVRFGRKPQDDDETILENKRGKQDNFMRFGRTPQDDVNDFFRSGRGKQDNFMRFGRIPQDGVEVFFDPHHYDKDKETTGKRDNFLKSVEKSEDIPYTNMKNKYLARDIRAKQDNFMRFGKSLNEDYENSVPLVMRSTSSSFGRLKPDYFTIFGRSDNFPVGESSEKDFIQIDDQFERERKSKDPNNLVRFGRKPPSNDNSFIRFGRRHSSKENGSHKLDYGIDDRENIIVIHKECAEGSEEINCKREKRSPRQDSSTPVPFIDKDGSSESDYVARKMQFGSSTVPELQSSLLSAGIPNVIVGPEFSLLPDLNPPPSMRNIKTGDKGFLRLG